MKGSEINQAAEIDLYLRFFNKMFDQQKPVYNFPFNHHTDVDEFYNQNVFGIPYNSRNYPKEILSMINDINQLKNKYLVYRKDDEDMVEVRLEFPPIADNSNNLYKTTYSFIWLKVNPKFKKYLHHYADNNIIQIKRW